MGIRIDIETDDKNLDYDLIESRTFTAYKKYFLENGLIITPKPRVMTKSLDFITPEVASIGLEITKELINNPIIAGMIAAWLYEKIKNGRGKKLVINGKEVKITKEDIEIAIKEEQKTLYL